jgi:hypothetical protein
MPFRTPDRFPGDLQEDVIELYDQYGAMPEAAGEILYSDGYFYAKDAYGTFNMRSGQSADFLDEEEHKVLRQLIHFIDDGPAEGFASGAYRETVGGSFPTSITWYTDSGKTEKIVEKIITRSGGGATNVAPTPIKWKIYDTDGTTVLWTVNDAVTYDGVFETSRTRTITQGDA